MSWPTPGIQAQLFVAVGDLLVYSLSRLLAAGVYFFRTAAWGTAGLSSLPIIGCKFQHHLLLTPVCACSGCPAWWFASTPACNLSVTHPSTGLHGSQRYASVCALWLSSHTFRCRLQGSWWSLAVVQPLVVLSVLIAVCVCNGPQAGKCTSVCKLIFSRNHYYQLLAQALVHGFQWYTSVAVCSSAVLHKGPGSMVHGRA